VRWTPRWTSLGRISFLVLFVFSLSVEAGTRKRHHSTPDPALHGQWTLVEPTLKEEKFDPSFIRFLKRTYTPRGFAAVIRLNFLYFRESPIKRNKLSPLAVKRTKNFLQTYRDVLLKAQIKYQVSPEIIAALIWLESQHGDLKGNFNIPSVFIDLLQTRDPKVIDRISKLASRRKSFSDLNDREIHELIRTRSGKKVDWALSELHELERMYKRDKNLVKQLKGSFAGAFGLPQFLPSSYNKYAESFDPKRAPNLDRIDDAIVSVAKFLTANGWKKDDPQTQADALYEYNRSIEYVKTIIAIAEQTK
jgi:membrane-bound lytic murein transglycosylase B